MAVLTRSIKTMLLSARLSLRQRSIRDNKSVLYMFEIWIPITIAAAFFQNLRSALQKYLKGRLSTCGSAYARFFYALPFAFIYILGLHELGGYAYPEPNLKFLLFCLLGGISQILFTVFLLWMFSFKSFAVGTTFSKLEVLAVAVLGALILGDGLNRLAIAAIVLGAIGVIALSVGQSGVTVKSVVAGLKEKSTMIGLVCATWLGGSVVFFRGASLSLGHENVVMAAGYSLTIALVIQTVLMGGYLLIREKGEFGRVVKNWRWAGAVGVAGVLASICWFTAFTYQNASYVRALGQIELLFTFVATTVFFKEKVSRLELGGILLVSSGIVLIILAA
ncbi:MAG: drug/metabolite transporter (DMT)-like permease [Parasphingorhabdus sp.]